MGMLALQEYAHNNGGWYVQRNGYTDEWENWRSTGGWSASKRLGDRLYAHIHIYESRGYANGWSLLFSQWSTWSSDEFQVAGGKCRSVRHALDYCTNLLKKDTLLLKIYLVHRYRPEASRTLYRLDMQCKTATPYLTYYYSLFDLMELPVGHYVGVKLNRHGDGIEYNIYECFCTGYVGGGERSIQEKAPWLNVEKLRLRGGASVIAFEPAEVQ